MAVITSTSNAAVKAARKLARRPARERAGAFLVEGPQAVGESIGHLRTLFVEAGPAAREHVLVARAAEAGVEVLEVTAPVLASLADAVTPQGLVGVAALAEPSLDDALAQAGFVVVLWEVAEPGNAGAIIRTADAGGADAVVLTASSVDPRNPKAVRASAGSLFHLPVVTDVDGREALEACRARGLQVLAADAGGDVDYSAADLTRPTAVVFGNEAHGLPADVLAACDGVVRLPIHTAERPGYRGWAESLNLAATVAVITYEVARQRGAAQPKALAGAGGAA
jgi:RNA methyltransferase, TrmH family